MSDEGSAFIQVAAGFHPAARGWAGELTLAGAQERYVAPICPRNSNSRSGRDLVGAGLEVAGPKNYDSRCVCGECRGDGAGINRLAYLGASDADPKIISKMVHTAAQYPRKSIYPSSFILFINHDFPE